MKKKFEYECYCVDKYVCEYCKVIGKMKEAKREDDGTK